MALSTKVAMLTCLGFTAGMCWLVSKVARPMVEMPTPLVVRGPDTASDTVFAVDESRPAERSRGVELAGRFAERSPLEPVAAPSRGRDSGSALVVAATLPPIVEPDTPSLPPPHIPEAPIVARAEPAKAEYAPRVAAAESVSEIAEIPQAVIGDRPVHRPRMLAALVSSVGTNRDAAAAGGETDPPARPVTKYKVKRGDTLVGIMRRHYQNDDPAKLKVLLEANPQLAKRRDRIYVGEVLNIPDLRTPPTAPVVAKRAAEREANSRRSAKVRYYTIRKRDSLASIARRFLNDERRWPEIARLNQMRNAHKVLPGTRIMLPALATNDT